MTDRALFWVAVASILIFVIIIAVIYEVAPGVFHAPPVGRVR